MNFGDDGYSSDSRWDDDSEASGTMSPMPLHERPIPMVTVTDSLSSFQREVILARNAKWQQTLELGPCGSAVVTLADHSLLNFTPLLFDSQPRWMETEAPVKARYKRKWKANEVINHSDTNIMYFRRCWLKHPRRDLVFQTGPRS